MAEELGSEEVICEGCGNPVDDCECRCPYCGEIDLCDCCCGGTEAGTGG